MLPPRQAGVMILGHQTHAAKLLFEKYFLLESPQRVCAAP
jgi:hypothetical protein